MQRILWAFGASILLLCSYSTVALAQRAGESTRRACSDGEDNDNDGRVDCSDVGCADFCGTGRSRHHGFAPPNRAAPVPDGTPAPEPIVGLGTAIGAGWASAQASSSSGSSMTGSGLELNLGTLEIDVFFHTESHLVDMSLDISLGLIDMVILAFVPAFYMELDLFYTIYLGTGRVRGVFSMGVGMNLLAFSGIVAIAPAIPARLGVEFQTRSRTLAFRLMARPFFNAVYATAGDETGWGVGGGVLGEFAVMRYIVRR